MHSTQEFEHLLDLDNVTGVEYDEDGDVVITFVETKVPEDELDDDQIVANATSKQTDVIETGAFEALTEMAEAQGDRHNKHRPVPGGVSEINVRGTAATGGLYPVEVTDTSSGKWSGEVSEGDIVRLSNNHVYARTNKASFGEKIIQPSPYDGGGDGDAVGSLVGYVDIGDGATVDVAARTSDGSDSEVYHELGEKYPRKVLRDNYKKLKGQTLIKTGRTTGVTKGDVKAVSASIRVRYSGGTYTFRDVLITGHMSKGGDSGSPVFVDNTGDVVGLVFAGSPKFTVLTKASNIESELGVSIKTEHGENDGNKDDNKNDSNMKYAKSLDTDVSIEMEEADLDLEKLSGDKPKSGETVTVQATMVGNYAGEFVVAVQGNQYESEFTDEHEQSDGTYKRKVGVEVTAPDEFKKTFDVNVVGGYKQ